MNRYAEMKEQRRRDFLRLAIVETFGLDEAQEDQLILATFEPPMTRMLQFLDFQIGGTIWADFFEDVQFDHVSLPSEVRTWLRRGDVFLVEFTRTTVGWAILWMSPPYDEVEFDELGRGPDDELH